MTNAAMLPPVMRPAATSSALHITSTMEPKIRKKATAVMNARVGDASARNAEGLIDLIGKALRLALFLPECLHHAHGAKDFRSQAAHARDAILAIARKATQAAPEPDDRRQFRRDAHQAPDRRSASGQW